MWANLLLGEPFITVWITSELFFLSSEMSCNQSGQSLCPPLQCWKKSGNTNGRSSPFNILRMVTSNDQVHQRQHWRLLHSQLRSPSMKTSHYSIGWQWQLHGHSSSADQPGEGSEIFCHKTWGCIGVQPAHSVTKTQGAPGDGSLHAIKSECTVMQTTTCCHKTRCGWCVVAVGSAHGEEGWNCQWEDASGKAGIIWGVFGSPWRWKAPWTRVASTILSSVSELWIGELQLTFE